MPKNYSVSSITSQYLITATINNNIIATVNNSWCISGLFMMALKISLAVIKKAAEEIKTHGPMPRCLFHRIRVTIKKSQCGEYA